MKQFPCFIESRNSRHSVSRKLGCLEGILVGEECPVKVFLSSALSFYTAFSFVLFGKGWDDVPLCLRMMSAGLLATPAELRTMLPREGREVKTYHLCECIQVLVCTVQYVYVQPSTPSGGANLKSTKRHHSSCVFCSAQPFLYLISLPLRLIPVIREWTHLFWGQHPLLSPLWPEFF